MALVILLHDALGQRQPQSPAALLRGEARTEHVGHVFLLDALAVVCHLNGHGVAFLQQPQVYLALAALHRIYGVLAQVLNHPLEQRGIHLHHYVVAGIVARDEHLLRRALVHVGYHVVEHLVHRRIYGLGQRPYLGEALGNALQPLHVLLHLGNQLVGRIILLQHLHPCHETGDGGAQLMGRLLRQAHPHLVLLGPLRREQGKHGHDGKDDHNAQLPVGPHGEPLQHGRFVIAHVEAVVRAAQLNLDQVAGFLHLPPVAGYIGQRVLARHLNVAPVGHVALLVHHNHGYGVVALNHARHQRQVGRLVGIVVGIHGLCPHLHLVALLHLKVAHQIVRH